MALDDFTPIRRLAGGIPVFPRNPADFEKVAHVENPLTQEFEDELTTAVLNAYNADEFMPFVIPAHGKYEDIIHSPLN